MILLISLRHMAPPGNWLNLWWDIPNHFVYGNPISESNSEVFTGRQDIAKQVTEYILGAVQPPTLLLYGQRRMGKTSILKQLSRLLGPEYIPIIIDCQYPRAKENLASFLSYTSQATCDAYSRHYSSGGGVPTALDVAALAQLPFARFDESFDEVEITLVENMRLIFCIDEYEDLQAAIDGWGNEVLDAIRHWSQHRRVIVMFAGLHRFEEMGPNWTNHFINTRRLKVGPLTRDDVILLLTRSVRHYMKYGDGAVEAIIGSQWPAVLDASRCLRADRLSQLEPPQRGDGGGRQDCRGPSPGHRR